MRLLQLLRFVGVRRRLFAALLVLPGCVSTGDPPGTERAISNATGVPELIVFQIDGAPVDAPGEPSETLTLPQAVQQALTNHPDLQAALARVLAAQAQARQSRQLPNPILSVAVRYPDSGGKPTIEAGLAADLISLLARPGRVSAADHRLRAASADAVSAALDIAQDVEERYVAVQALDALMPVLEARRQLLDRLLETARSRLRAGEGTELDVTTIDAQRVELDLEIAESDLERREEQLALARLMGRPSSPARWKLDGLNAAPAPIAAERDWIATALERRAEIQSRQWELAALGDDLSAERLAPFDGAEVGADTEKEDGNWAVGPAMALPLPMFDWGQARREELRARQIEARHVLVQQRRLVVEEVRRAHAAQVSVSQALEQARQRLIPLMRKQLEQAESQYLAGLTDITALTLAEEQLQAAQAKRIDLERRALTSLLRLERAAGGAAVARELSTATTRRATTVPAHETSQPRQNP